MSFTQSTSVLEQLDEFKRARLGSGEGLIDLSMINPDFVPDRLLLDRLVEFSLKTGNHRYSVARGIRKLRSAFAHRYKHKFKVLLNPEDSVCVVMGSKGGLSNILQCSCRPGDGVGLPYPTYPAFRSAVRLNNLEDHYYQIDADEEVTLANIRRLLDSSKLRVLILNFPNNPTGTKVGPEFYRKLTLHAREQGCLLVNDFVYGEMGYHSELSPSLLSANSSFEGLLEVCSLSKSFSIPGWRVAGVCGDSQIIAKLSKLKSQVDYGTFLPIQLAAAAALESERQIVSETLEKYKRRYGVLAHGLVRLGWQVFETQAGCCVWAKLPNALLPFDEEFTSALVKDYGVCPLPGVVFGDDFSEFMRFALVQSEAALQDTLNKLEACTQEFLGREANCLQQQSEVV